VETSLMTAEEIDWLDAYHARVRKILSPLVDTKTRKWLQEATRKVA
jgi:Xaa-Pro aminopeptidase